MNTYTCYVVESDGHTDHTFERRGRSADEIRRSLKREYPGAVVVHVWSSSGEESKEVKGGR